MQKNRAFKKYQLPEKLIFAELLMNFTDFRQNDNNVFTQKKLTI